MKENILKQLSDKFNKTNGGMYVVELMRLNKVNYNEIKPILTELFKEKKIVTKKGINGILIHLK